MNYFGDFAEDATVYIPFNTFDSNDPSASVTITDLAQGDVEIWKDGVVQGTPGAGVTLTLNIGDNNGSHLIAVDTSDVTDGGFYATGADYQVRINGTTVDGATINAWVGTFSIEDRYNAVNLVEILGTPVAESSAANIATNFNTFFDDGDDATSTAIMSYIEELAAANLPTDIADIPTVAEFEARTIVSADYVVVGDTIAAVTSVTSVAANGITATSMAADSINAASIKNAAIDAAAFAANAITSTVVADNTVTAAKLNADCITNAKIADDAIGAENFATDALSADALSDAAVNQIWAKAFTDLAQGAPSATASVFTALNHQYMLWRNKTETTATKITVFRDDEAEELITSTISDDGITFSKSEFISGA